MLGMWGYAALLAEAGLDQPPVLGPRVESCNGSTLG